MNSPNLASVPFEEPNCDHEHPPEAHFCAGCGSHYCAFCESHVGHQTEGVAECTEPCDHCRPEVWHGCVLPTAHAGYHSCEGAS